MITFYITLAACPVLLLGTAAFLTLIVVGIRKGDRGDLSEPPRNRLDTITRRMAGLGVRNGAGSEEGES